MIENYYNIKHRTVTVSVPCDFTQGCTTVFTFTPSETGTYNFKITYDLGTVIYVIDPRSAEEGVNTGLYSGTSLRLVPLPTEICFHLDAGIRYLVIYAPSNINSNYQDGGLLTVNPDILNPTVPLEMPEAPYGEEDEAA